MSLTLVIGNRNYSSWSLRAWLYMHAMGLRFGEVRIPLDQPGYQATIRQYSPSGCVPVLLDGDVRVWESLAICEYVADKHNLPAWPEAAAARGRALAVAHEMHAGFAALRAEFPMNCRATKPGIKPSPAAARDIGRVANIWRDCREEFGDAGPWLFGTFGIADAMYAPVAFRCRTYGLDLNPIAQGYVDRLLDHPSAAQWLAEARAEAETIPACDDLQARPN